MVAKVIKKPKTTVKKKVTKKVSKRKKAVTKIAPAAQPVEQIVRPITPVTSTYTAPVAQAPIEPGYKAVKEPVSRAKMWVAVTLCSVLIAVVWAYSLGNQLLHTDVIGDSVAATGVEEFVKSISGDWNEIQDDMDALSIEVPTNTNTTTEQVPATVPTNTNNSLDNLFSDL